ncbi:MAG: response regulator [Thermoanaerobaculales bacterium]
MLVVEDDDKVAAALERGLTSERYEVAVGRTGEEGFFLALREAFDLIVLDLMLPGQDGLEILSALRERGIETPVLVLTAKGEVEDRVEGLDRGADDYLVKPFAFPELLARIRALLRRGRPEAQLRLAVGELEMDLVTRRVARAGKVFELTGREWDLIECLMRRPGRVVSRETIAREVWHEPERVTPIDNLIDVYIARLRRKIDEPFGTAMIRTVRGVGFLLEDGG